MSLIETIFLFFYGDTDFKGLELKKKDEAHLDPTK